MSTKFFFAGLGERLQFLSKPLSKPLSRINLVFQATKSMLQKIPIKKAINKLKTGSVFLGKFLIGVLVYIISLLQHILSPAQIYKYAAVWGAFLAFLILLPNLKLYKVNHDRLDELGTYYYGINYDPIAENRGGDTSNTPEREKAALVALVRNSELHDMRSSIKQLENRWNHKYNYPYVFFNDEKFTDEFKEGIRSVTNSECTFIDLDTSYWSVPDSIDLVEFMVNLQKNKYRYIYGGKVSYRLMCRFQGNLFYKHPALAQYKYYWRIEPDVDYYCNINYDPFRYMRTNNIKYGFTIAFPEIESTIETLWETTRQWIELNPDYIPEKNAAKWLVQDDGNYNNCHFWSNFEIVDLDFYRGEAYESYVKHLDSAGGYFYERWGDAPIHSIAASVLLPKEQIFWFEDIGYRHSTVYNCPSNFEMSYNCYCKKGGSFHNSHCHNMWNEHKNMSKDEFFKLLGIKL